MKLLIVFALVFAAAQAIPAPDGPAVEKDCATLTPIIEKGLRRLALVNNEPAPRTAEEVHERCNQGKKLYPDFKQYKKCLPGKLTPQIFEESTKAIGEILKQHCSVEGEKTLFKVINCVPDSKLNEIKAISAGSFKEFLKVANMETVDRATVISKTCCLSHISAKLVSDALSGTKCEDASVNPQKHFSDLFGAIQRSGMDLTCGDWKDLMTCESKIPTESAAMKSAIMMNKETTIGDQSILEPVKTLANKISD